MLAMRSLLKGQVRTKTFRKTNTKAFLAKLQAGDPYVPVKENRFFAVSGLMKVYKSVSPGSTHRRHPTRFHLHKGSAIRRLSFGKRSTGGRSKGRITVRHRGGGHKKRVRCVDFMRADTQTAGFQVVRFEYDPNRTAELCLLRNLSTNEFSYIIRPADVKINQTLHSYRSGLPTSTSFSKAHIIQPGNCLLLKDIPVGTKVHCVGLKEGDRAQLVRAAGASAVVLATGSEGYAQIRLASKEVRLVSVNACATIGTVANELHKLRNLGKAGASRRLGIRPSVRGIAMNPNSHPHGGGRKSKGGRAPRSPWGWLTKGPKTVKRKRWFILTPRWKANKN